MKIKEITLGSSNKKYKCYDIQTIKNRHPLNDYYVVGEIEFNEKVKIGDDNAIRYHAVGHFPEDKYKTLAYIQYGDDVYIAIKKKKNKLLMYLLCILIAIILLLAGFILINNKSNKADIDPNASDYVSALKRPDNIDDSKILIPGYGKFTIQKGSDTIDTVLFNPEDNPCYFQFTLVEKSTGDILYESKLVPPGQGITPVKISKSFNEVGTYDAILKFKTVDFEDTDITYNGSDIDVTINVVE